MVETMSFAGFRNLLLVAVLLVLGGVSGAAALPAVSVGSGEDHSCAIMHDGTLRCWGDNDFGQVGDGSRTDRNYAVQVPGLSNVISVAPSRVHTCAVESSGTVKCWGDGQSGQLGDGVSRGLSSPSLVPVAVTGITTATQVASGSETTCALLQDTTVRCWGRGDYGTRGDGSTANRALSPVPVSGLAGVAQIIGGRLHMCALMLNQSLRCWGSNFYGELGNGTRTHSTTPQPVTLPGNVVSADGGAMETCAVLADGRVFCWGGTEPDLGRPDTDQLTPAPVAGITGAIEVGVGSLRACARLAGSVTKCWNSPGVSPTTMDSLAGAAGLSIGRNVSCAWLASPSVKCWGSNYGGSLGNGGWDAASPGAVVGFTATPSITSSPSSPTANTSAAFTVSGPAGATYECSVDSGAFALCGNPPTVTGLADGERSIRIRAMDSASNPSVPTAASSVVVDVSADPPGVGPSIGSFTNQTWASFAMTGEAGATFECSLDGAAYASCGPSASFGGLTEGAHTFRARQVSVLNHVSLPTEFNWSIDVAPPDSPRVSGRPGANSPSTSASFEFAGEAGASFACSLDGDGESGCGSPYVVGGLTEGSHTVVITQIDAAGNRSQSVAIAWNVDTVEPAAPRFAEAPVLFSGNPAAAIVLVGEAGATFLCSRDGDAAGPCAARQTVGRLPMGPHTLTAWQVDVAGNRSEPASTKWITVPTPPSGDQGVSINDAATFVNKPAVTLDLIWPEGATQARIANDGGFKNARTIDLDAQVPWALASSGAERLPKTVYVRFKGYLVDETKTHTDDVILDETPPQIISATADPSEGAMGMQSASRGRPVVVRVKARDRTSGVRGIQIAASKKVGAPVLPYRAKLRTRVTGSNVWVRVRDGAGNWSRWKKA
jgi:alpha-tubulin suppressor-like RCC1 family protein